MNQRIALVKTTSMGDVLHTLPVLRDIARACPGTQVDWLVEAPFADLIACHPDLHHVHTVDVRRWRRAWYRSVTWQALRASRQAAQTTPYDHVIDCQGLLKSAALTRYWVQATTRHGYDRASAREPLACLAYDRTHHVPRPQHAIDRCRMLVAKSLGYDNELNSLPLVFGLPNPTPNPDDPYVVALHGTTWPSKAWPIDAWRTLAQGLKQAGYRMVIPWASAQEHQTAQQIADGVSSVTVLPRQPLVDLQVVLQRSHGVVSVDTGLGHLAAAMGLPTVGLYGPTDTVLTGMRGPRVATCVATGWSCQPCFQRTCPHRDDTLAACMAGSNTTSPTEVLKAFNQLVQQP